MKPKHFVVSSLLFAAALQAALVLAEGPATDTAKNSKSATAAPATAPTTAPTAPPKPAPELDEYYKVFAGTLKCESTFAAGAMGPGSPEMKAKTTVRIRKDLDGFWYRGEYETKATKTQPGMKGVFYLGYDPASKQALITAVDNAGGASWGTGRKQGDSIVFEEQGFMLGMKVKIRETMTSGATLGHKVELDAGKGYGYQPFVSETCTK